MIGIVGCGIFAAVLFAFAQTFQCVSPSVQDDYANSITNTETIDDHDIKPQCDKTPQVAFAVTGAIYLAGAFVNLYFWLCVFSFYKGLKSGELRFKRGLSQDESLIT